MKWLPPSYLIRKRRALSLINRLGIRGSFLEVGCGRGDFSIPLAQMGWNGLGIDISEEAVKEFLCERDKRGISPSMLTFEKRNIFELQGSDLRFDIIVCFEVLEHIEDDLSALRVLSSLTKRYVLASFPVHKKKFGYSDRLAGHYRRYDRKDVCTLFHKAGLM